MGKSDIELMKADDAFVLLKLRRDLPESTYQKCIMSIEHELLELRKDKVLIGKFNYYANSINNENTKFRVSLSAVLEIEDTIAARKLTDSMKGE